MIYNNSLMICMVFDEGDMYKALGKSATKPPAKPSVKPAAPRIPTPAPAPRVEESEQIAPAQPRPLPPPEQKAAPVDLSKPEFIELAKSVTETCRFYKSVILPLVALMLVLTDVAILVFIARTF